MKTIKNNSGFSLLELLLYIGLASTILLVMSSFFIVTLQSRIKNQTIAEVEQQGTRVMQIMTQKIHNATILTSPAQGISASSLSLNGGGTTFSLLNNGIIIGEKSVIPLTSDKIIASDLGFYNLSYTDTPGIVRIQFTLTHNNPSGRNEYDYSKTFYGSANLRDI